jgi:hypothetical protein
LKKLQNLKFLYLFLKIKGPTIVDASIYCSWTFFYIFKPFFCFFSINLLFLVAIRKIRKFQKFIEPLIPQLPFACFVRKFVQNMSDFQEYRIAAAAFEAL